MNYDIEARRVEKMHTLDRVIVLRPIEGKTPINTAGAPDKRIFTGENNLHAVYDVVFGLWNLKYDNGGLPGGLEGKFTALQPLLDHVRQYYAKRNIEIVEVRD